MSCRKRGSLRPAADPDRAPGEAHEWCRRCFEQPPWQLRPQHRETIARAYPWWSPGYPSSNLRVFQPGLPVLPPHSAPASSPSAPSADEPDDQEQQYRADRGFYDLRDDARTEMDPKLRKYPARNEGPRYSHDEIADQAQPCTLDDLACQPAGRDADSQYDEKAITRYAHVLRPHHRTASAVPPQVFRINLSEGGYCAKLIRYQSFGRDHSAGNLSNFAQRRRKISDRCHYRPLSGLVRPASCQRCRSVQEISP